MGFEPLCLPEGLPHHPSPRVRSLEQMLGAGPPHPHFTILWVWVWPSRSPCCPPHCLLAVKEHTITPRFQVSQRAFRSSPETYRDWLCVMSTLEFFEMALTKHSEAGHGEPNWSPLSQKPEGSPLPEAQWLPEVSPWGKSQL